MEKIVNIIGAGLAGCEAAYQLIKRNIKVRLYEMRPHNTTGAHKTDLFAELVCSNSLRAAAVKNAVGLLKEEMRIFDSLIMKAAEETKVEAGGALAVDREMFSTYITDFIKNHLISLLYLLCYLELISSIALLLIDFLIDNIHLMKYNFLQ